MPYYDGTGPQGTGPNGRGMGPCGGGMRRGMGRCFYRQGFRGQAVAGLDPKQDLEQEENYLKQELEAVKKALAGLKKSK